MVARRQHAPQLWVHQCLGGAKRDKKTETFRGNIVASKPWEGVYWGHKNGTPLLQGQAERAGSVQTVEEKAAR